MSEWKEYTGSDGQIAEIKNNKNGYIVRNLNPYDAFILSSRIRYAFELWGDSMVDFEYLICNPHPLANMICKQARTGQPVWVKMETSTYWFIAMRGFDLIYQDPVVSVIKSTTPDWNIPGAAYSFTPFDKEEV